VEDSPPNAQEDDNRRMAQEILPEDFAEIALIQSLAPIESCSFSTGVERDEPQQIVLNPSARKTPIDFFNIGIPKHKRSAFIFRITANQ
jgi:hypothetical protein